jgi:hypothetical protein
MSVYTNPKYFSGPRLQKKDRLAADGLTWQAGQFGRRTDSGVVVAKSNATVINTIFAETQATATSSSTVKVYDIPAGGTRFLMGVTNANADTKALTSYIGGNYGLAVNSCVCTLSTGNDSNEILNVIDIYPNVSSNRRADTSDVPGFVIAQVVESARTAEGTGQ